MKLTSEQMDLKGNTVSNGNYSGGTVYAYKDSVEKMKGRLADEEASRALRFNLRTS